MIRLDKKLADEFIRLTKKYYKTGNTDYLDERYEIKKVLKENTTWQTVDLLDNLAKYIQTSGKGTYDDIYRALEIFGIIVKEIKKWIMNY